MFFFQNFQVWEWRKKTWTSLQCFRKVRVSKIFMHIRGVTLFPGKIVCHTVPKVYVKESYCFWENFRSRKVFTDEKEGGRIQFLRRKNMVSQCRQISWASLQGFRKIVLSGKFEQNRGITFFCQKYQVWECQKIVDIASMFQKFLGFEKFYA